MTTIKRYSFKEIIRYKGNSYKWNSSYNVLNKPLKSSNLLRVEVYNRRLEGKSDLYGNLYKPSIFYYNKVQLLAKYFQFAIFKIVVLTLYFKYAIQTNQLNSKRV